MNPSVRHNNLAQEILFNIGTDRSNQDIAHLSPYETRRKGFRRAIVWAGGLVLTGAFVLGAYNKVEGDKVENRYPTADEVCVIGKADKDNTPLLKVADKYWDGGDEIRGGAARMGEASRSNPDSLYGVCFDRQEQHNRVVPADHIPQDQVVNTESFPGYTN
jgi:hypothetical protein